ncbi:MAG: zinc ribbon domain-containing protein [Clostridia bacterium]|nr:zinc ribbon domain-containing protein [Clostridia bacterium]
MAFNFDKLNSFLNKAAENVNAAAKTAAKKTGEVAESAKLTIALKTEQSKLEGLYNQLGKLYYEKAEEAQLAAQVLEIDEQKVVIEQLKAEIAENSGKVICPGCGKEISVDVAFCPACGTKQEEKKKSVTTEPAPKTETPKEAPKEAPKTEAPKAESKPLTADEFVSFFKATVAKYYAK